MPRTTPVKLALIHSETSQVDLARKLGIPITVLNMIVNGNRRPTSDQARKIARCLRVSRRALFTEEDPGK